MSQDSERSSGTVYDAGCLKPAPKSACRAVDFLCIGAQRGGTTWLHLALSRHSKVWTPPIKEVHHFDATARDSPLFPDDPRNYRVTRWLSWAKCFLPQRLVPKLITTRGRELVDLLSFAAYALQASLGRAQGDQYIALFSAAQARGDVCGEITPAYAALPPLEVSKVRDTVGDARILYVIRDPIERIWSQAAKDMPRAEHAPGAPERRAEAIAFVRQAHCRARTTYARSLRNWQAAFGPENVLLIFFDDIRADPNKVMSQVEAFLELPRESDLTLPGRTNSHERSKSGVPPAVASVLATFALEQIAELRAAGVTNLHLKTWEDAALAAQDWQERVPEA